MTCRHGPDDIECSSHPRNQPGYVAPPPTPDASNYQIVDVEEFKETRRLVLKVKYPNCAACVYEGVKVMVFENTTPLEALKWKHIDPHFRDPNLNRSAEWAPCPVARFPASADGWAQAKVFAALKFSK